MSRSENTTPKMFEAAAVKWAVTILGGLLLAGAVSLANRDVYNKKQVDEKIQTTREWSDAQDRMIMISVKQQGQSIDTQLKIIRDDQREIKKFLMEKDRR